MTAVVIAVGMFLLFAFLVAWGRSFRTTHPPIEFERGNPSEVDRRLEEVRAKLAAKDAAAFAIYPIGDVDRDADGQIWLFAAADGVLDRISIELGLPDSVSAPERDPAVASFLDEGWDVQEVEPGHYVLLTHRRLASADGLAAAVVEAMTDLFGLAPDLTWRCRAIA